MFKLPFVMEFVVYLTGRCNLRCKMCSQYGENYKENACKELDFETWKKFFRLISDVSPKPKIVLIGGEPLLYRDIDKILTYLNKKNFNIQIVTNGVYLDKHLSTLKKCKNLTITISLDGLKDLHDSIRGIDGTFEKVINNIDKLNILRKRGADFKIYINTVILPDNISNLFDFYKFIQSKKVDQVVFQHLQFISQEQNTVADKEWTERLGCSFNGELMPHDKFVFDNEYITKLKNTISELEHICKVETFVFPYLPDDDMEKYYLDKNLETIRPYLRCATPWTTAYISPLGDVSNCISNKIGNITDSNFWDIWNNEKAQNFRKNLSECGNFSICAKCCNFYKNNFLYAPASRLLIKGKEVILPAELNYILPCDSIAFILNKTKSTELETYAYIREIHSKEMMEELEKEHVVVGYAKDIQI